MECLFRTHTVLEMIDKETGDVVYREVSKSKEFDTLVELLGYAGTDEIKSKLTIEEALVTYDDEGFPNEPEVRTHELSEDVKKVVYEEATTEPDAIFSDMEVPEPDDVDGSTADLTALAGMDDTMLTEALASDTDTINEFSEVSDMSVDLNDDDGKEDKRYSFEDLLAPTDDKSESENDSNDEMGIDISLAFGEPDEQITVASDLTDDIDLVEDMPFANAEEEDTYKERLNRVDLDNLF